MQNSRVWSYGIILFLIVAAAWVRAPGLGKWCITVDEFYFSEPVKSILNSGLPELKGGGYYVRGFGLTYLTALSAMVFKSWEFAIRFPVLIFGVVTIPLFFFFCTIFIPLIPSLLCTATLLFSSWHIEFSRFARFYVPFQFVFLAFLYCFYRGFWEEKSHYRHLSWALAVISITIYEGSIFIPLIFLLPLLVQENPLRRENISLIAGVTVLLVLNVLVHHGFIDFGSLGTGQHLPAELIETKGSSSPYIPIALPSIDLILSAWSKSYSVIVYLALLVWASAIFVKQIRVGRDFWSILSIGTVLILSLFHQFGLMVIILAIVFLNRKEILPILYKNRYTWIIYVSSCLLFWILLMFKFGFISPEKNQGLHFLIGFPPVKKAIIQPFIKTAPFWSLYLIVPTTISVIRNILKKEYDSSCFLLTVIILIISVMACIKTPWKSTRYSFFYFPLLLIPVFIEISALLSWVQQRFERFKRKIVFQCLLVIPLLIFAFTEDFHSGQIVDASAKEITFRMGNYDRFSDHWYPRVDLESPDKYVDENFEKGDIIVIDHPVMSVYLDGPYVNFISIRDRIRFPYHARKEGTMEKWTGRPLISKKDDLAALVPEKGKHSMWLIAATVGGYVGTSFSWDGFRPAEIAEEYHLKATKEFTGLDGRIGVWRLRK